MNDPFFTYLAFSLAIVAFNRTNQLQKEFEEFRSGRISDDEKETLLKREKKRQKQQNFVLLTIVVIGIIYCICSFG